MNDKELESFRSAPEARGSGVPAFDVAEYMQYVEGLDMTEEQKVEFLQRLWWIMAAFVDLGFGVDSVIPVLAQRALESRGDALKQVIPTHEFNAATEDDTEGTD